MFNIENEKIILDSMIMSPKNLSEILEIVNQDDFYLDKHVYIFGLIKELHDNKIPITVSTIYKTLEDKGLFDNYKENIAEILKSWTGGNIQPFIESLKEDSARRKINALSKDLLQLTIDKTVSLDSICQDIDKQIKEISANQTSSVTMLSDLSTGRIEDLSSDSKFYRTGFKELDNNIHGIFSGELIILAARPKCGKSAMAGNIACSIAELYHGENVLFFSLEMSNEQLRRRFVSSYARLDSFIIKIKKYTDDEQRERVVKAMSKVDSLKIGLIDNEFNINNIVRISRRFANTKKISVIVIDYLQLIVNSIKGANREQVISDSARQLKQLAKELKVPVMCLSQLSREVEKRTDKRPILSDLRESGAIEQHADMVWFLYREEKDNIVSNQYEIIVAANRDGKANFSSELYFNKEFTLFEDI